MVQHEFESELIWLSVTAITIYAFYGDEAVAVVEEFGFGGEIDDDKPAEGAEDDGYGAFDYEYPV